MNFRENLRAHFGYMRKVQNIAFGMGKVGDIGVGDIIVIVRKGIRKVAAWATHSSHSGGGGETCVGHR